MLYLLTSIKIWVKVTSKFLRKSFTILKMEGMVGPKSIASKVLEKSEDYTFVNVVRFNEKVLKVIIRNNFEIK